VFRQSMIALAGRSALREAAPERMLHSGPLVRGVRLGGSVALSRPNERENALKLTSASNPKLTSRTRPIAEIC